jgi:putative flippase GtrA
MRQNGRLVTAVRELYRRFRQLIHEVAKFGVVGATAFLATTIGTNLLHFQAGLGPLTSNVIATVAATGVAFFGNRYWTFRHREGSTMTREYVVFFALNGIGLAIQLACIGFTYYLLDRHGKLAYNIALIFGIGLGTLFRFWSYRRWVWLAPAMAKAGAGDQLPPSGPPPAGRPAAWAPTPGDGQRGHPWDRLHPDGNTYDREPGVPGPAAGGARPTG